MTLGELLNAATKKLALANIDGGVRDARILLRHVLGEKSGALDPEAEVSPEQSGLFTKLIEQRCQHQPVSQILGKREFWGRAFSVSKDTLDPRPESELLIELALERTAPSRILDLGTGTGCLLLTLLAEIREATGVGVDISDAALRVAQENADQLGLSNRAAFLQGDWLEPVSEQFDLIICNPPYISEAEMSELQRDVVDWEPHIALSPGGDGLAIYRMLAVSLPQYLSPNGSVILEIGESQAAQVSSLFDATGSFDVEVFKDINGKDRAVRLRQAR